MQAYNYYKGCVVCFNSIYAPCMTYIGCPPPLDSLTDVRRSLEPGCWIGIDNLCIVLSQKGGAFRVFPDSGKKKLPVGQSWAGQLYIF